ncbi:MAG: carbonic anhydrase, partial [Byssovorax sp.]
MARWHDALRAHRRRPLTGAPDNELSNVMFVLCSESHAAAELVAAFEPALVLQLFGGARTPSDAATRATIAYAVRDRGVRHVVVCGHEGCLAVPAGPLGSREATL